MNSSQKSPEGSDWIKKYKVGVNIAIVLLLAVGLLIYALYTPARQGYSRVENPEFFFVDEDWVDYVSEEAGFSIQMPKEPEIDTYTEILPDISYETKELLVMNEAEEMIVQYGDYQGDLDSSDPTMTLLSALQGGLAEIEGIQLNEAEEFEVSEYPALQFQATSRAEGIYMQGIYVLIGQELFTLLYISDDPSQAIADKFFSSFVIFEEPIN